MGVSTDFINQLKMQVRNAKDQQEMNRGRIAEADAILAEAQAVRNTKVEAEEKQIASLQRDIDNLEYTIKLLEAQLPPEPEQPDVPENPPTN